jgi:hypothetical protein
MGGITAASMSYTLERNPPFAAPVSVTGATEYTDSSVSSGSSYSYRVKPTAAYGFSPFSCSWIAFNGGCVEELLEDPIFKFGATYWTLTGATACTPSTCSFPLYQGGNPIAMGGTGTASSSVSQQFNVNTAGSYDFTIQAMFLQSNTFNFQVLLDTVSQKSITQANTSYFSNPAGYSAILLSGVTLSAGSHTITFSLSKGSASSLRVILGFAQISPTIIVTPTPTPVIPLSSTLPKTSKSSTSANPTTKSSTSANPSSANPTTKSSTSANPSSANPSSASSSSTPITSPTSPWTPTSPSSPWTTSSSPSGAGLPLGWQWWYFLLIAAGVLFFLICCLSLLCCCCKQRDEEIGHSVVIMVRFACSLCFLC